MIPGITSGMLKTDLLKAVARGLDFGVLRLNLAEPGVLQVADNQTLRVQLTVGRFELEGEGTALVSHDIGGYNFTQVIIQMSVAVRQSVTLIEIEPEELVCTGCLVIYYETGNEEELDTATFYLYVTDIELISL